MFSRKELTNGKYVDDQMGNGIPEGGTTGQVLKKNSNADYDVIWGTGGGGGSAVWGGILGTVTDQTDLISYLAGAYYPLSSNPAGYLTSETDPVFSAWLATPPNISTFTNDSGYLTSSSITGMVTGSGAATRLAFWNGSSSISSDSALNWDNVGKQLCIGGIPSGYTLEVLGTGFFNNDVFIANQSKLKFSSSIYIRPEIVSSALKDLAFYTNTTERLRILDNGTVKIDNLSGSGTRMVVSDSTGLLSTQTIPTIPTVGTWGALNYPTWTTGTPFVKMNGVGSFILDNNTYLTGNQTITLSGDVSGSGATSITTAIGNNKVTNAMLDQVAASTFKGRVSAGTGNVEDLTGTQATSLLDTFTSSLKGLAPASGGGTTNFLRADGTWAAPPGGGTPASPTNSVQFNDSGSFGGDSNLTWDNVNKYLGIGTATPTVKLDVKGNTKIVGDVNSYITIGAIYEGGVVAYILQPGDPGYDANYVAGFIATASDLSGGIQWYNGIYVITYTNNSALGTGFYNTIDIVSVQSTNYIDYAAGLADVDVTNGYTDWYLPSKDELNKLYINRVAIGGFSSGVYWSSTESDSPNDLTDAWTQDFSTGTQIEDDKSQLYSVRAIRNFSIPVSKVTVNKDATVIEGNVGIGTSTPTLKLDVNGQMGLQYITLDGATSAFGLDYFTLQARENDTGIAAIFKGKGNPAGYGYVFQFAANNLTNGLLILGDNTTSSHVFSTDAYPGGGAWPLKFRVADVGQSWGAISDLMVLTPDQKVGIGNSSPVYKLDVTGKGRFTEGVVETTDASVTLSAGDFTIPGPGIYKVSNSTPGSLLFPNPANHDGQRLTIINADSTNAALVSNGNGFAPYERGRTVLVPQLGVEEMWEFVSIGGEWRGIGF